MIHEPLGVEVFIFHPRKMTPSGARTSKSDRVARVSDATSSAYANWAASRERFIGWSSDGPISCPTKADKIKQATTRKQKVKASRRIITSATNKLLVMFPSGLPQRLKITSRPLRLLPYLELAFPGLHVV